MMRGMSGTAGFVVSALVVAGAAGACRGAVISRDINSYVLFAYDELIFKGGNEATNSGYIVGGHIGVNYVNPNSGEFALSFATSGRAIMSDGMQAVADSVRADPAGSFYDLFANRVNTSFGAEIRGSGPAAFSAPIIDTPNLPTLGFTPNRAITNGASDLTVNGSGGLPSPQTLLPGAFRDVRFNDNSVITLGAGVYDMRDVSIGKNVTINLSDATILRVDEGFTTNDNLLMGLNPGYGGLARLLIGGFGDNPTTTRTTNWSHGAEVHAQYFAPNSWLDLGGGNNLYGRYWAKRITGDPNNNVYMVPSGSGVAIMVLGGVVMHRRRRSL